MIFAVIRSFRQEHGVRRLSSCVARLVKTNYVLSDLRWLLRRTLLIKLLNRLVGHIQNQNSLYKQCLLKFVTARLWRRRSWSWWLITKASGINQRAVSHHCKDLDLMNRFWLVVSPCWQLLYRDFNSLLMICTDATKVFRRRLTVGDIFAVYTVPFNALFCIMLQEVFSLAEKSWFLIRNKIVDIDSGYGKEILNSNLSQYPIIFHLSSEMIAENWFD